MQSEQAALSFDKADYRKGNWEFKFVIKFSWFLTSFS